MSNLKFVASFDIRSPNIKQHIIAGIERHWLFSFVVTGNIV